MPVGALAPLLALGGFTFQSLQYGEHVEGMQDLEAKDFLDTARAIESCDLVITVDTSVAHLAGCQGVPTWLLLPFVSEWRWLLDRDDSPWYPSMTLYRQAKAGDWGELVARVVRDLVRKREAGCILIRQCDIPDFLAAARAVNDA